MVFVRLVGFQTVVEWKVFLFSTSIISMSLFIFSCLRFFLLHVLLDFTDFAVPWLSCKRFFFVLILQGSNPCGSAS